VENEFFYREYKMRADRKNALEKAVNICRGMHEKNACFECDLGGPHDPGNRGLGMKYGLGLILIALDVPEGNYHHFVLEVSEGFATCHVPVGTTCGDLRSLYRGNNETTWQAFIDEIISLVDG
jgi:hypothetical protein